MHDSFGDDWELSSPPTEGAGKWSLFHTAGLGTSSSLVVWPVVVAPQGGALLDDIMIGIDEDANMAWAVELKADGRTLLADDRTDEAVRERRGPEPRFPLFAIDDASGALAPLPEDHESRLFGDWQQGIVADLTGARPRPRPGPVSRLIGGPSGPGFGRGHEIASNAIPSGGVALRRRAKLARDTNGKPILWVERSASPIMGPPTSHLRFDVLAEDTNPAGVDDG